MTITPEQLETLIAAIVALITAIMAILKNREANIANTKVVAAEAVITDVKAQVDAFNPETTESTKPEIIATLPTRSWKMSDSTRRWCTFDATPANRIKIEQQIDAAEQAKLVQYQIYFDGGYYNIEYGLLKGGAGNPSGDYAEPARSPPAKPVITPTPVVEEPCPPKGQCGLNK